MPKRRHGRVRAHGVTSNLHSDSMVAPKVSVENLSLGGAFLRTPTPMPVGSALEIELARPGVIKRLRLTGRVVSALGGEDAKQRNGVPGMGICFDPPGAEDEERLRLLLLALAPNAEALHGDGKEPAPELASEPAAPAVVADEPVAPAAPPASPAPPTEVVNVPDSAKLMVQVRGLILEMSDWQSRAQDLERENEALRAENAKLKAELARYAARFE